MSPYVADDPSRPYSSASVYAAQDSMISFISGRAAALPAWVGERP